MAQQHDHRDATNMSAPQRILHTQPTNWTSTTIAMTNRTMDMVSGSRTGTSITPADRPLGGRGTDPRPWPHFFWAANFPITGDLALRW